MQSNLTGVLKLTKLDPKYDYDSSVYTALQNICSGNSHLDLIWLPVTYLLTYLAKLILAHWFDLLSLSHIHWLICCYFLFLSAHIWEWIWGIGEAAEHGRQKSVMHFPQWVDSLHLPSPIPQLFIRHTPIPAYCIVETATTVYIYMYAFSWQFYPKRLIKRINI